MHELSRSITCCAQGQADVAAAATNTAASSSNSSVRMASEKFRIKEIISNEIMKKSINYKILKLVFYLTLLSLMDHICDSILLLDNKMQISRLKIKR